MRKISLFILLWSLIISVTQAQDDTFINYGETVTIPISLDEQEIHRRFMADAGDIIGIDLQNSFEIAQRLTVLNSNGDLIIESTPSYSPNIDTSYFSIPASGDYTIVIEFSEITIDIEDLRDYELRIYERATPILTKGSEYRDSFTENTVEYDFVFEGVAGELVSIYAESDRFDLTMVLLAPDGTEIASDDDSGSNLNPAIEAFSLEQNGLYRVIVPNSEQTQSSVYLTLIDYQEPELYFDESITLTIQPDAEPLTITIEGQTGDVVSIRSENLEDVVSIEIFDGNGSNIATNQNWIGLEQTRLGHIDIGDMASLLITPLSDNSETITLTLEQNLTSEISDDGLLFHLSPEHRIQTFSIKDPTFTTGGSFQGGQLNIIQAEVRQSMAFRITLMQNDRVVLSYVVDDLVGLRGLNSVLRYGSGVGFGSEVTGTIELLGDSFAVFRLSNQWLLGIG